MALSAEASQIGSRVKRAREEAGLTQAQVAQRVGVSVSTYPRWERGEQRIPQTAFIALATILGKPLAYFGKDATRLSETVSRGTSANGTTGGDLPRQLRLRENQVERDLIDVGATDVEVRAFSRSVRADPRLAALFSGGAPEHTTADEAMQLFEAVATAYKALVEQLVLERTGRAER